MMELFGRKKDCRWLMMSLFGLILLMPLLDRGRAGTILLSALMTLIFITAIGAVSDDRRYTYWAMGLMAPPILLQWLQTRQGWEADQILLMPSLYNLPIYVFIGCLIVRYLFKGSELRLDHLFAAISLYLLLGLFWTHLYMIVESVHPGSFVLSEDLARHESLMFAELFYFSYVTLTSLGYGDVQPLTLQARSLAICQAVVGVLFVATLIGRIAGSAIIQSHQKGEAG